MSIIEKTGQFSTRVTASLLLGLAATIAAADEASPLPALKSVSVEVDVTSLPASEQAALVPILRAARQMDTLYIQQVWPGTRAPMTERRSGGTAASSELDALNFFKGPWLGQLGHHNN